VRDAQLRWYAGCLIVATPLGVVAATSDSPWIFLVCIGGFLTLISSFKACAVTALNLVTPNGLRGTGVAFYGATSGLFGAALGPMLIAILSQLWSRCPVQRHSFRQHLRQRQLPGLPYGR
jgi:MFS family permease